MIPTRRTSNALSVGLVLALSAPLHAQARLTVPCTVRIRPIEAADYDLGSEVTIQGRILGREGRLLLLEIKGGRVRVDPGRSEEILALAPGTDVLVVAAKVQEEGHQRLLARLIRIEGRTLVLRVPKAYRFSCRQQGP